MSTSESRVDPHDAHSQRASISAPRTMEANGISMPLMLLLTSAVAIVVLNLYASQPLIALIASSLGISTSAATLVTTFTLLGYAAGLELLVPLVDLVANRRLIVATL